MESICNSSVMDNLEHNYGLFKKGDWKAFMTFKTKREAMMMLRKQYKGLYEIRKLIK